MASYAFFEGGDSVKVSLHVHTGPMTMTHLVLRHSLVRSLRISPAHVCTSFPSKSMRLFLAIAPLFLASSPPLPFHRAVLLLIKGSCL